MNKWILIEVENQNINEPDTYDSYIEAYDEMKNRYENLVEEGDEASIDEYDANIQTDSYNIDWKIYEVEAEQIRISLERMINMERVKMVKNSPKYGFKKGDEFVVKRNIMGECVIIMTDENVPNLIWSESKVKNYGILTGKPQLCFS